MADDLSEKVGPSETCRLSSMLRLVGIGKFVLASLTLVLAFTGYETPKSINFGLLFVGIALIVLGRISLTLGKSFGRASDGTVPPALEMALIQANKLFTCYLILILLAVLWVGNHTLMFLGKILSKNA